MILFLIIYLLLYYKTYLFFIYLIVFAWTNLTSFPSLVKYKESIRSLFSFWGIDPLPLPEENVIYIANYPAGILSYLYLNLLDNITLLGRRFSQVGKLSQLSRLLYNDSNYVQIDNQGGNYETVLDKIKEKSTPIFGFGENLKYRRDPYKLTPLRKGLFAISRELDRPIVPIVFDHLISTSYFFVPSQIKIYIGPTFYPNDYETTEELISEVENWMSDKLTDLKSSRSS